MGSATDWINYLVHADKFEAVTNLICFSLSSSSWRFSLLLYDCDYIINQSLTNQQNFKFIANIRLSEHHLWINQLFQNYLYTQLNRWWKRLILNQLACSFVFEGVIFLHDYLTDLFFTFVFFLFNYIIFSCWCCTSDIVILLKRIKYWRQFLDWVVKKNSRKANLNLTK